MSNNKFYTLSLCSVLLLSACSNQNTRSQPEQLQTLPDRFHEVSSLPASSQDRQANDNELIDQNWIASFGSKQLEQLIDQALTSNFALNAERMQLERSTQQLVITGATDYPELNLALSQSRRKLINANTDQANFNNNAELNLQLNYELDLWGRLSDSQQQASFSYQSARANYKRQQLLLAANVSRAWFDLLNAQQLLQLFDKRATNLQANLVTIQNSYRLGLSQALDVYLTQNNVNQELARVAQQKQVVNAASRSLELLLGQYPSAEFTASLLDDQNSLPHLTSQVPVGLPASLLTRRQDLQASWLNLLSLDAGLAVAHKQRFPRLSLTGSIGQSSTELDQLLSTDSLAWSILGNLTSPLFNAGRLKAIEQQAQLSVESAEFAYLQQVYQAFLEVENALTNQVSLTERYQHLVDAKNNAEAAETLAFDQYLKGIVTYTTVLEAQRRAFDAQTSVIQLNNQIVQNRIDLHLALGGDFSTQVAVATVTATPNGQSTPKVTSSTGY